jgi:Flp pilus assembly protein TadD
MYEEAIRELKKGVALSVRNGEPLCYLGYAYAASGRRGEAFKLLDEVQGLSGGKVSPYNIAMIYAGLGERDRAFEQLEKAYNGREEWLINLDVEIALDGLRSDPRFQDLLRRMGLKS